MKLTRERLLKKCREAVRGAKIRRVDIKDSNLLAVSKFEYHRDGSKDTLRLYLDIYKRGIIQSSVHEALHYVLSDLSETFDDDLEEVIIRALENHLWMQMDKKETERWRRLLRRKLKEG